jgi:hypothetical protein
LSERVKRQDTHGSARVDFGNQARRTNRLNGGVFGTKIQSESATLVGTWYDFGNSDRRTHQSKVLGTSGAESSFEETHIRESFVGLWKKRPGTI